MTKGEQVKIWEKYDTEGEELQRDRTCPRCGEGTFMAEHGDRVTCGRCGFSEETSND